MTVTQVKYRLVSEQTSSPTSMTLSDKQMLANEELPTQHRYGSKESDLVCTYTWQDVVWRNVILLSLLHIVAGYAFFLFITDESIKWQTSVATFVFGLFSSSLGITAGAHRYFSHKAYKAKLPLRLLLVFANTMALQNDIYEWCRDHRAHHRYSETNADPHNSRRGFFFAHCGWLMLKKHKDVKEKGKSIDMSDLARDPLVTFQRQFYIPLIILIWGVIPSLVPYYLWNERIFYAFMGCVCFRYVYVLHCTWLVNSAAHLWGHRPYDRHMEPRESNMVVWASFGEGYHNYHHSFAWDYSASELGFRYNFNITTLLIDFFHSIGWAYDLRKPSAKMIEARKAKSGDGTDNRVIRRQKVADWAMGLIVTTSQLFLSLTLRFLVTTIKAHYYS